MASPTDHPCRAALTEALALLDRHGPQGAACYVAMALDCLDDGGKATDPVGTTRAPQDRTRSA